MGTRMSLPSFSGLSPRSELWIAFSMAPITLLSYGCTTSRVGSGAESVASWLSGVLAP